MSDEYFTEFLEGEGFAPALDCHPVDEETLNRYQGKLPDRLLGYWKEFGFCGYGEGLFWTVNPADYEETLELWLKNTPLWGRENYYVIARTAFGKLYVWGDKTGNATTIISYQHTIMPQDIPYETLDKEKIERFIGTFFSLQDKENADAYDKNDKLLFKKALKKLGQLKPDEMYAFVPALSLGGVADIKSLQKVKLQEQLSILAQLEEPTILKTLHEMFGEDLYS
ncbi:FIG00957912: hypothetical protein [hydrothermal vent metagenome]|uniref:GAD-like domain protein n=1 Tax=hydrothermal vent metagenome TaxID=652676 RepID=A0A3B0WZ87_9ZZZZ